jgi:Domain of unknown function (DUF4145)
MAAKVVQPQFGAKSFSCPHCGALADETWYKVFVDSYRNEDVPSVPDPQTVESIVRAENIPHEAKRDLIRYFERVVAKVLFIETLHQSLYINQEVPTLHISRCFSCGGMAVWHSDKRMYPSQSFEVVPNDDMPPDIRTEFLEAGSIVDLSPRGAAALLRLCIQKLMKHLGESGENINNDIGALVQKGLDARVQQALDVVRVVGNQAVHPGSIDLRDDKATAIKLFELVNIIVENSISVPKRIQEMYGSLPAGALEAIEKRDGTVPPKPSV